MVKEVSHDRRSSFPVIHPMIFVTCAHSAELQKKNKNEYVVILLFLTNFYHTMAVFRKSKAIRRLFSGCWNFPLKSIFSFLSHLSSGLSCDLL